MALGPGKYDEICTYVRETAQAEAAIVIVFGGEHGNGFSCQANMLWTLALPDLLERVACDMRASMAEPMTPPDEETPP